MKNIIFLLLLIPITLNAQLQSICDITSSCTNSTPCGLQPYHTTSTDMDFSNEPPLVLNIFFHDYDVEVPIELTEADFLASTAYLNQTFNKFNIFFKYRGFDNNTLPIENMLNIFVRVLFGGTAWDDGARVTYKSFINEDNTRFILAHEIGHIFCLLHLDPTNNIIDTFSNPLNCNGQTIIEGSFPVFDNCDENVTRVTTNPDYNADIAGDFVIDTPAMYLKVNQCINLSSGTPILEYLPSNEIVDATGTSYIDIDVNNIMARDTREDFFEFKDNFTDGQGIRMRESIENRNILQSLLAPVSSLYEPYQGTYFFAGPNLPEHRPLFQPGFDYKFVSAGGQTPSGDYQIFNTPSDYYNTNFIFDTNVILNEVDLFSLDLNNITHPNRSAIVIEQLEEQPRRCYHNANRGASSGTVIKFNDNIFNQNYTIIEKDSLGINQPTLFQDLENGLYLIKKNYNDGTQEQKAILKINNHE